MLDKARDEMPRPGDEREQTLEDAEQCTGSGSLSPAMVDKINVELGTKSLQISQHFVHLVLKDLHPLRQHMVQHSTII